MADLAPVLDAAAPPSPLRSDSAAEAAPLPSPSPLERPPSCMAANADGAAGAAADDTQPADGALPIEQTQAAEETGAVEDGVYQGGAQVLTSEALALAADQVVATDEGKKRKQRPDDALTPEPCAKGFKAPTLLRDDKVYLNQVAAFIEKQDPKKDARDRFGLEEMFTLSDHRRTVLENKWAMLLVERSFASSGDETTLATYNYFNRELYKLHKVMMMVSRKLSYDADKPHFYSNLERYAYTPPDFVDRICVRRA
jgi:hypothetical protein